MINATCDACGITFKIHPYRLKREHKTLTCSKKCMGQMTKKRFLGETRSSYPKQFGNGYVYINSRKKEHIEIAEKVLGRRLKRGEVVHHIDLDKTNNKNSNLMICTQSYHAWIHQEMARRWAMEHIKQNGN